MAVPVTIKRSTTAGAKPASLLPAEIAVNIADSPPSLFVGDASGAPVQVNAPLMPANLVDAADDATAASNGVPVQGIYRNGSILMVRVT